MVKTPSCSVDILFVITAIYYLHRYIYIYILALIGSFLMQYMRVRHSLLYYELLVVFIE